MSIKDDGGPVFPTLLEHGFNSGMPGMTLRDHFASHAPISFDFALSVWGNQYETFNDDKTRLCFMAIWSMLRYEYADAMIEARK